MTKWIVISLPVADLKVAMAFYEAIGFKPNAQFTEETTAWMVLERDDQFHAARPRQMADDDAASDPTEKLERGHADPNARAGKLSMRWSPQPPRGGTVDINPIEDHGSM